LTNNRFGLILCFSLKGPSMSYDIDKFVNTNPVNVEFNEEAFNGEEEQVFDLFKRMADWDANRKTDDTNDDAYPVIVLEKNNVPYAWYDLEMFCGYLKA